LAAVTAHVYVEPLVSPSTSIVVLGSSVTTVSPPSLDVHVAS